MQQKTLRRPLRKSKGDLNMSKGEETRYCYMSIFLNAVILADFLKK